MTLIMNCSRLEAEKSQLAEQLVHEQATRQRLEAASNSDDYIDSGKPLTATAVSTNDPIQKICFSFYS